MTGLWVLAAAPHASASDLTVDGLTSVDKPLGSSLDIAVTGTPTATAFLLVDLDPGPSSLFGSLVPIGFSPSLVIANIGLIPAGGTLEFTATVPSDPIFEGITIYLLAAVADAPMAADYDYSNGANLTLVHASSQLAGNPLGAYPFFEFVRAFNVGTPITVAVDPSRKPGVVGRTGDIYVVASKDAAGWAADPSLTDVSGDGFETHTFVSTSIQANTIVVDTGTLSGFAGADVGVGYDIVIDFDQDGVLDTLDLIDGIGNESGLYVVHDLTRPGPYAVIETIYKGGAFLGQNLFYPSNIASLGELPLVVVSHGAGHNFQWYGHIGEHLASYGFIVMSHQNNTMPGVETASTTTLTNTDYLLGNLEIIAGGALDGHLDDNNIFWIGHSRGGEGVVRAYDRIFDGTYVPANFGLADIRLISSIAPTDFLGFGSSNPHGVNYHLWTGGADTDIDGCAGCDICQTFQLHDRGEQKRMSISLHGVGHGDFHDGGGSSVAAGPCLVGRPTTHTIMRGYILPLAMHHQKGNIPSEDFLWRQWESFAPLGAPVDNPCVVVDLMYREAASNRFVIDDFQTNFATSLSSSGGAVSGTVQGLTEGLWNDEDSTFTNTGAPWNGFTIGGSGDNTRGTVFEWDGAGDKTLKFDIVAAGSNVTKWEYLSFRACQATRDDYTIASLGDVTFDVTLTDGSGATSTVNIGTLGGGIEEPYQRPTCGVGVGWANEFETIRLRLYDFTNNGSGLDLTDIESVTFTFGPGAGSIVGRLGMDDVEFTTD
jgi:hypothetical protein